MNVAQRLCIKIFVSWRKTSLFLCVTVSFLYLFYEFNFINTDDPLELMEAEVQSGCVFPNINPFDSSLLQYIKHPPPVKCRKVQPYLTYMDDKGYLKINATELRNLKLESPNSDIVCTYKTFDRSQGTDDKSWTFDRELVFNETDQVRLKRDMVFVTCRNAAKIWKSTIYKNLHVHPSKKEKKNFAKPNDKLLSVLLMGIDSVSFSEFQRNMPLTFDYVTKQMKMFMFRRFNKIGDNTLRIFIAILTGKRLLAEQNDMLSELNHTQPYTGYYDHLDLLWKHYASKGYATVFNEDQPHYGMFHLLTKGFAKKPVDYYYPIFWRLLEEEMEANGYDKFCFGNTPKGQIMLDMAKRHIVSLNDVLQFMITFSNEYSHELNDDVQRLDADFATFWKEMFEGGYLNKTVVIFMSDHGHRFSDVRRTMLGLLEERNPFYGLWFPDWFYCLHPHIKTNLNVNINRLSSTFDIHETLKDVLHSYYDGVQRPLSSRGLSQLYPMPENRTCSEAGVPEHHCLCFVGCPIDVSSPNLTDPVSAFVNHLNFMLSSYKNQCHLISLTNISRAESLKFSERVKGGVINYEALSKFYRNKKDGITSKTETYSKIRLTIETDPNGAMFEALLNRNNSNGQWYVNSDVERLNAYGNTSYCINDAVLRKYCTCKKQ